MPHLPGSGDTSIGSGGGCTVGVRAAAAFENGAGATWPDAAPLLRRIFYSLQKAKTPTCSPFPTPPPPLQDRHRPVACSRIDPIRPNPAQISRPAVRRLVLAKLASFPISPYHDSPPLLSRPTALTLIAVSTPTRVSASACQLLQVEAASSRQQLHNLQEYRFRAIPMIFLQVVQLLSQACCLPLPELHNLKLQSSSATSRFAKSI